MINTSLTHRLRVAWGALFAMLLVIAMAGQSASASTVAGARARPAPACDKAAYSRGDCLAMWQGKTDDGQTPVISAVRQAMSQGPAGLRRAERYVSRLPKNGTADQEKIRTRLVTAVHAEKRDPGAGQRLLKPAQNTPEFGPGDRGDGTVTGPYSLDLTDTATYNTCQWFVCEPEGEIRFDYRVGIYFFPEVSLGGSISKVFGANFHVPAHECTVQEDISWASDQERGRFTRACDPSYADTSVYNILDETITQQSGRDKWYYLQPSVCVQPDFPIEPYCNTWETKRWHNPSTGSANFPQWNG